MTGKRHMPRLESIQRIYKIPVVETGVNIATGVYGKIKNSNPLTRWYLGTVVEGSVGLVVEMSLTAVPLLEIPITVADSIVCEVLDTVQQRVPAINYPPEKIINKTKDYVSTKIVQPVLKRAESAKEFTVHEATKYGELAATKIDTALDVADQYVEKYLPDASEPSEGKVVVPRNGENKAIQTIDHVNRLSRKLQRRLTKRTIAEAKALRKQGVNVAHVLFKLAELMIKDPRQFAGKMKELWLHLSQDEPENQVPPANLEQLITMITRETARRCVHLTNYTVSKVSKMPGLTVQAIQSVAHQTNAMLDYVLKIVHLERVKAIAVSRVQSQIRNLNITLRDVQLLIEKFLSGLLSKHQKQQSRGQGGPIPLHTLSPVAQSPERTQETTKSEDSLAQNASNERNEQSKPRSPKKQQKSKTPHNASHHQSDKSQSSPTSSTQPKPEPEAGDENSNKQVPNGATIKT